MSPQALALLSAMKAEADAECPYLFPGNAPDKPLSEIGLDSLDAVHMIATIESIIRKELPEDIIKRITCLNDIFEMMRDRMAAA